MFIENRQNKDNNSNSQLEKSIAITCLSHYWAKLGLKDITMKNNHSTLSHELCSNQKQNNLVTKLECSQKTCLVNNIVFMPNTKFSS